MSSNLLNGFYLNDVHIEPVHGQVLRGSESFHLPPTASEVLLCLAEHAGQVVSREQLIETVWGEGKGSPEALSHAIGDIRRVLDDHHDHPTFIQTLPRRGYRLLVTPHFADTGTDSVVIGAEGGARLQDIGLLESLRQRGVFETALAYLVLGWLLIQIADIVFDQLLLPRWAGTFVTVLVIAGFPIALILSWFIEVRGGRAVLDELSPRDRRRKRFDRTYLSVLGGLTIAAVAVFIYDRNIGLPEEVAAPTAGTSQVLPPVIDNSFAVLPFLNIDGSDETRIFADGLVDELTGRLARIPELKVSSRGDASLLLPNSSSREVRDRLRVEMYVEGSVETAGDRLRVIVQLIDSNTGFHVLARTFDGLREDYFSVRDEITGLIVANIRVALPADLQVSSLKVTEDPRLDAFVLYRRGVDATRQPTSMDSISSAIGWFDASLSVDPEYAAAHAGKCLAYVSGYTEVDDSEYIDKAKSSCAAALSLNPNLDIVHTALGDLYRSTGEYAESEAAYEKALALNARNLESKRGLSEIFLLTNRLDDAEDLLVRAIDDHPGDSIAHSALGFFYYYTGRYEDAVMQFEASVQLNPRDMNTLSNLGTAYMLLGRFDDALTAFQKSLEINPRSVTYSNLGLVFYFLDRHDESIANHTRATELEPNDHVAMSNLADAYWAAGQKQNALQAYERAHSLAEQALEVNPNDPLSMMDIAWIKANLGRTREAAAIMDDVLGLIPDDPYAHYYAALCQMRSGNVEAVLSALQDALDKGYEKPLLSADPVFAELRGTRGFKRLL